jgi:hypothetical protein
LIALYADVPHGSKLGEVFRLAQETAQQDAREDGERLVPAILTLPMLKLVSDLADGVQHLNRMVYEQEQLWAETVAHERVDSIDPEQHLPWFVEEARVLMASHDQVQGPGLSMTPRVRYAILTSAATLLFVRMCVFVPCTLRSQPDLLLAQHFDG